MATGTPSEAVDLLPEGTNLIHIGPEKTGSTAIQSALFKLRPVLADYGVVYPGNPDLPRPYVEALGFHGMRGAPPRDPAEWPALLAEIEAAAESRVCVSHEVLGRATDEQIVKVVQSFGGENPHVLMVARRYDSYLPSRWQQDIKARVSHSYPAYLELVLQPESTHPLWEKAWIPHDTANLARRWASVVGLDAVTVLIADDQDHSYLPGVFESLLGLPPGLIHDNTKRSNRSLTYPEAELLRRMVVSMKQDNASLEDFHHLMRKGVLRELQSQEALPGEARVPRLPEWAAALVRERSAARLEGLEALQAEGLRVIGDLDRLRGDGENPGSEDIAPPDEISIETAARFVAALSRAGMKAEQRAAKAQRRSRAKAAPAPEPTPGLRQRLARLIGRH